MELGADGFNGDTLDGVNQTWWEEGLLRGHPGIGRGKGGHLD